MRVRKRPIEVDAWQLDHNALLFPTQYDIPKWVLDAWILYDLVYWRETGVWYVQTLEGEMSAYDGDYLIRGVANELYPCRGEIFRDTYEVIVP